MLRVGLTGGLGSGKSTVAAMLARHGARVLQADEIGREMMRPGQAVYAAIVERFGPDVVRADGELDRAELARLAFAGGRVEELNAIVHPAVIARQAEMAEEIGTDDPEAVVVVESALILETKYGETKYRETKYGEMKDGGEGSWRERFDRLILVQATEALKIARYVERASKQAVLGEGEIAELKLEAQRRLGQQMNDAEKAKFCDYLLRNDGLVAELEIQVTALWPILKELARPSVSDLDEAPSASS